MMELKKYFRDIYSIADNLSKESIKWKIFDMLSKH